MLTDPLPALLDVRKLAASGAEVSGYIDASKLLRFREELSDDGSKIAVDLRFFTDERGIPAVEGNVQAEVGIYCQRCLQGMPYGIESRFLLGMVYNDEQMRQLPKEYDPWLVVASEETDLVDVIEVVEDELLLSLPYTSYHELEDCDQDVLKVMKPAVEDDSSVEEKSNPFSVLQRVRDPEEK